jgi:hypothetical protein
MGPAGASGTYQTGPGLQLNLATTPPTIDVAQPYVPVAGGTMTGTLTAPTVDVVGVSAGFVFADRTGGSQPNWTLLANGGTARLNNVTNGDVATVSVGGNLNMAGGGTFAGPIYSSGSTAGLRFNDISDNSTWQWYGSSSVARLRNNVTDLVTISESGNVSTVGNLSASQYNISGKRVATGSAGVTNLYDGNGTNVSIVLSSTFLELAQAQHWITGVGGSPTFVGINSTAATFYVPVVLPADPTTNLQAATKQYVDAHVGGGGGIADAPSDGTTYGRLNTAWTGVLPLAGGTLTGALNGTTINAATQYNLRGIKFADPGGTYNQIYHGEGTDVVLYLGGTGDARNYYQNTEHRFGNLASTVTWLILNDTNATFLRPVVLPADPTTNLQAATKQYVDSHVGGLPGGTADYDTLVYISSAWTVQRPRYSVGFSFVGGVLATNQLIGLHQFSKAVTINGNFGAYLGHNPRAGGTANATASTVITVQRAVAASPTSFSTVGTITFAAGTITPTFTTTGGAAVSFAAGDVMRLIGPSTADTTFANIYCTLIGWET